MTPKVKIKTKVISITKSIDYGNGFRCEYLIKNGKINNYRIYNKLFKNLYFINEDTLEKIKNSHWSTHHDFVKEEKVNEEWLFNFDKFESLYYLGGGMDGMLATADGKFISTPISLDEIFFACWVHLETTKSECETFLQSLKSEYIISSAIVYIPYYNHREDKSDHYTLKLMVKIPDDIYLKILGNKKYLDDICRKEILIFLKGKILVE